MAGGRPAPAPVSGAERPHHFNSATARERPGGGGIFLKEKPAADRPWPGRPDFYR